MLRFKRILPVLLAAVSAAAIFAAGCAAEPEMTLTGRYYPVRDSHLILTENNDAIAMNSEDETVFDGLTIGDQIEVHCDMILTTYPGSTAISSLRLLEDGTAEDLPEETLATLLEMNWISEDLPSE
jgi:hypothetical protein